MKPQHWAMVVLILFGASVGAVALLVRAGKNQAAARAEAFAQKKHELKPMWPVPAFSYPDQHGSAVTRESLQGRPWVANFIFTTCRSVCPLLTAKMVQLQRKLAGADIRFVSFSVDPANDTPEVLLAYARHWAPQEKRWSLLATDAATLPKLATAFHVTAEKNDAARPDEDPIIHSSIFVLVDAGGQVRGVYDSEHREEFLSLVRDTATLASVPAVPVAVRTGEQLYRDLSCAQCHDRPELAPPLAGLYGKRRELTDASLLDADEAYVRESILAPEAKRVRGYALKMPTYDGVIDDAELQTLLVYLQGLQQAGAVAEAEAPRVEADPVCHMDVAVLPDAYSAEHGGHRYWFCSEACRDRFLEAPAKFVGR